MQCWIQFRRTTRIHLVQTFGDGIALLPFEVLRNRFSVQFASRNAEPAGSGFRQAEEIVRHRYSGLHGFSITRVILTRARLPYRRHPLSVSPLLFPYNGALGKSASLRGHAK